jgi:hypothetical protein
MERKSSDREPRSNATAPHNGIIVPVTSEIYKSASGLISRFALIDSLCAEVN